MRSILITLLGVFLAIPLVAQQGSLSKQEKKHSITQAQNYVKDFNYSAAITLYNQIITDAPSEQELFFDLGYCYYMQGKADQAIESFSKVIKYYKIASDIKKSIFIRSMFFLGESYILNYDFINAKQTFEELLKYCGKLKRQEVQKKIQQCDFSQHLFETPVGFSVICPDIINSDKPDYCPVITSDSKILYFTSRRDGSTGGKKFYDGDEYEDIYRVNIDNGNYSVPENIGTPINTDGHEATSSISADGTQLFLYRSDDEHIGDIYYSNLVDGKWEIPEKLYSPINTKANETHASLSPDGKTLYFTSNRKKGHGGLDIYSAGIDTTGKWTIVKNLGTTINTPQDEEGPFVSPDGKYLYFSSRGHKGMGGFDIFKSKINPDGTLGTPENMGFPVNTVNDDVFYVPTKDPAIAFYSSKQLTGVSSIYIVHIFDAQQDPLFVKGFVFDSNIKYHNVEKIQDKTVIAGGKIYPKDRNVTFAPNDSVYISNYADNIITDSICKIPANAKIKVLGITDNSESELYYPVKPSGKYGIVINPPEDKLIHFFAPNHIYDICRVYSYQRLVYFNAELDTIIYGKVKSVKHTTFEYDTKLSDYQQKEFNILANFLNTYNKLFVDISAFGKNEKPEKFDTLRTKLIVNYLLERGVKPEQIRKNSSINFVTGADLEYTIFDTLPIEKIPAQSNVNPISAQLITDISFELNKYSSPRFFSNLDILAQYLHDNEDAKIGVYGYTDTQGNSNYNKKLSAKRAMFVKKYLINKNVPQKQIEIVEGKGYTKQISINKNNKGNFIWESLGYNRRSEIFVLQQGSKAKLYVKPVEVPKNYKLKNNEEKFSIALVVSKNKLAKTQFDVKVTEILSIDGSYTYIYGRYNSKEEANNILKTIKEKYSTAFVFVNNYRK